MNNKWSKVRDFIVKNCKIAFPVLLIAIAAVTVVVSLRANQGKVEEESNTTESTVRESTVHETAATPASEEIPLVANEDEEIYNFVTAHYEAMGNGDADAIKTLYDEVTENDLLYYGELSKYIDHYANLEVYTKPGPVEETLLVYAYFKMGIIGYQEVPGLELLFVCCNENGQLYIKSEKNYTDEENTYITKVNEQADVVEFYNRVNVEYNELMTENPQLLEYLGILGEQVQASVGEIIAERNAVSAPEPSGEAGINPDDPDAEGTTEQEPSVEVGPQYAIANATVNVRSSASVQADKLGKLAENTRIQVQETLANGWTRVLFEGKDGFVKSEFLTMEAAQTPEKTPEGVTIIGSVTATAAVNVRSEASTESPRLGLLAEGESLELVGYQDDWCIVMYNGRMGYIKAEFVREH